MYQVYYSSLSNGAYAIVQESTPPTAGFRNGARWYKPSEATSYILYADGDSSQWIQEAVGDPFIDASRLTGFVIPEQYGAVADGVTDDSQAITAAIATGKVVVLGGRYAAHNINITTGFHMLPGSMVINNKVGDGSVLRVPVGNNGLQIGNIYVDANSQPCIGFRIDSDDV
jgi:hypothetical protein